MKRRIKGESRAKRKLNKRLGIVLLALILLAVFGVGMVIGINAYVKSRIEEQILAEEEVLGLQDVDCILVLGCLVKNSGEPSHMPEDRLRRAVELYHAGVAIGPTEKTRQHDKLQRETGQDTRLRV